MLLFSLERAVLGCFASCCSVARPTLPLCLLPLGSDHALYSPFPASEITAAVGTCKVAHHPVLPDITGESGAGEEPLSETDIPKVGAR